MGAREKPSEAVAPGTLPGNRSVKDKGFRSDTSAVLLLSLTKTPPGKSHHVQTGAALGQSNAPTPHINDATPVSDALCIATLSPIGLWHPLGGKTRKLPRASVVRCSPAGISPRVRAGAVGRGGAGGGRVWCECGSRRARRGVFHLCIPIPGTRPGVPGGWGRQIGGGKANQKQEGKS
jgi:hypothetical protein